MTPVQQDLKARAERKLETAYARVLFDLPFFAAILYRMRRVADFGCDTMWVDGRTLGYSPAFVLATDPQTLTTALCHEVAHVLGLHHLRRGARDPQGWNVACDHVVNGVLRAAGRAIPAEWLAPITGKTPEALYKAPQPKPEPGKGTPKDGTGEKQDGGKTGPSQPGEKGEPSQGKPGQGQPGGKGESPQPFGEVRDMKHGDGTDLSPAERDAAEDEAKVTIAQAVRIAQKAGNLPGGIAAFAEAITTPTLPWQEVLSRWMDERTQSDYTWLRPNLRYLASGVYLPSLSAPAYGGIAIGVDTSGSVGGDELNAAISEVRSCLDQYTLNGQAPEITVLWTDTEVHAQVVEDSSFTVPRIGRGGTRFAPVFRYIEENDLQPKGIIYITDGECSEFGTEPDAPVLWVLVRPYPTFKPPFGEVITMARRAA